MLTAAQTSFNWVMAALSFFGALLSIAAAVIRIMSERRRKALTCDVVSTSVVNVHEELAGRLLVIFDDRVVTDIGLVIITMTNSGSQTIVKEDFHEPLTFSFAGSSRIISAEVRRTFPPDLPAVIKIENVDGDMRGAPAVIISPLLLNSGDSVTLRVLVTDFSKVKLGLRYHIRDIPHIAERIRKPLRPQWKYALALTLNTIGVSALVIVGRPVKSWATVILTVLCVTPLFMLPYLVEMIDFQIFNRRMRREAESSPLNVTKAAAR